MAVENLWHKFTVNEVPYDLGNPIPCDPAGGILYCLRYDEPSIRSHRDRLVEILKRRGMSVVDLDDCVGVKSEADHAPEETAHIALLFGELSVANDACDYAEIGFCKYDSIASLAAGLRSTLGTLRMRQDGPVEVYEFSTCDIPSVVRRLRAGHHLSPFMTEIEIATLDELSTTAHGTARTYETSGKLVEVRFQ